MVSPRAATVANTCCVLAFSHHGDTFVSRGTWDPLEPQPSKLSGRPIKNELNATDIQYYNNNETDGFVSFQNACLFGNAIQSANSWICPCSYLLLRQQWMCCNKFIWLTVYYTVHFLILWVSMMSSNVSKPYRRKKNPYFMNHHVAYGKDPHWNWSYIYLYIINLIREM